MAEQRPGRPRSERARKAILSAAAGLLEREGLHAISMDAIAEEAGVSKATIYRWWPNKGALAIDASIVTVEPATTLPDTGSAREDLRRHLKRLARLYGDSSTARTIVGVHAQAQHEPEVAAALAERITGPRRASATEALRRGVARGELRPDLDPDLVLDALYGALYYNLLVSKRRLKPRYVDRLLDQVWPSLEAHGTVAAVERAPGHSLT
jgi:AcrR family transcriptional regulator